MTITATCPSCGLVSLTTADVTLYVDQQKYRFQCPCCRGDVDKPSNRRIEAVLRAIGVRTKRFDWPPFTLADVKRFRELLNEM